MTLEILEQSKAIFSYAGWSVHNILSSFITLNPGGLPHSGFCLSPLIIHLFHKYLLSTCLTFLLLCCLVAKSYLILCDPMDHDLPGSSVLGISQAKYWSVLSFPSPGDLPHPGIKVVSPALAGGFFTTEPPEKSTLYYGRS